MNENNSPAVAQVQALLHDGSYTPEQIAEAALHGLYPKLSEGSFNAYQQMGRGAVLMDLRDLEQGHLQTSYVPLSMLQRLQEESDLFDMAVSTATQYDPLQEFVVVVWQTMLLLVYRLKQV